MRGDAKVIEYLNRGLRAELTAVNQYWLHYRIFDNWGFRELAEKWRKESIEEMIHADHFTKRILFLEAFPNMQVLDPLRIGQTVEEIIACDLKFEIKAIADLRAAIGHAESVRDYGSRSLYESILKSEEDHIDYLQTQQRLIATVGLSDYIQLQTQANAAYALKPPG